MKRNYYVNTTKNVNLMDLFGHHNKLKKSYLVNLIPNMK